MIELQTHRPALAVAIVIVVAISGCNQRAPFLDRDAVTTAPSAVVPEASAGISRIALTPPGNRGGTSGRGTVYLDSPARGGGVFVTLRSSDDSIVTVSPQAFIPGGNVSADFSFTTRAVPRDVNVTITASSGERSIADYVSVWTPTTSFLAYGADPGVANPALQLRLSSDAGASFSATCNNGVLVAFSRGTPNPLISLWFATGVGQPVGPGSFENATDITAGNFIVDGAASNCQVSGRFDIHELGVLPNGSVNRLWVSFEHSCRNKPGTIRGELNISVPGAAAGTTQCVRLRP